MPTARAPPEAPLRERSIVTRRRRRGASRVLVRTQTSERTTQSVSYELITRTRARVVVRIARGRAGFTIGRRSRMRPPLGRWAKVAGPYVRAGVFVSARLAIDAGAFYSRRRAEAVRGLTDPARPFARHQALFVPWRVFQRGRGRV